MSGEHWFEPARLFHGGYPRDITSALRALPSLQAALLDEIAAAAPASALEVGPGDVPLIGRVARRVFADVTRGFLRAAEGTRVRADIRALPFGDRAFDLAVAADVLTHVPPADRTTAVTELARVARRVLLFNPEKGVAGVADSPVPSAPLIDCLARAGLSIQVRRFIAHPPSGPYEIALLIGDRLLGSKFL